MKKYLISIFLLLPCLVSGAKMQADIIIKNGKILTMNAKADLIENGVLVVKGNKIIALGDESLLQNYQAKKVIDAENGIVMPAMINAHTHLAMSLFRSLADDVPDRLNRYIFPLENKMVSPSMVYLGSKLGASEMALGGVGTLVDMYLFEEEAARAVKEVGLRGIMTQNIIKYPTADGKDGRENIVRTFAFIDEFKNDPLITIGFGPHAPNTVSKDDLLLIAELSKDLQVPVSMHVAETQEEFNKFKQDNNMTPVEYLDSLGLLNERFIAAHNIFVTDSDIELLKKRGVGLSHNMVANIKSAKGISPALKMYDEGLKIGLGSDGAMSGNTLDIISQLGYVAKLHKLAQKDRSAMPPFKVIEMATIGGARAINRDKELGSLEVGKLADIIIVETQSLNMNPIYDPYSALVYSANPSNVQTSIINGKIIVEDKKLKTIDTKELLKEVNAFKVEVEEVAKTL